MQKWLLFWYICIIGFVTSACLGHVWQARPTSTEAGGHSLEKRILAADGGSDSFTLKTNIASGWVTGFTPRHTPTKLQTSSQSQIQIHAQAHVNNSLECINAVNSNEAVVDLPLLPFIRKKEAWNNGKMQCRRSNVHVSENNDIGHSVIICQSYYKSF